MLAPGAWACWSLVGRVSGSVATRWALRRGRSAGTASARCAGACGEVTWRLVFFVNAPVGVALLVASMRLLPPDPPGRGGQLDVPGAITVTAGVALLVLVVG